MTEVTVRIEDISAAAVSKMVSHRTMRIDRQIRKLRKAVSKMFASKGNPSKAICEEVRTHVNRIQEMIVRNSDDASNLEAIIIEWKNREIERSDRVPYIY